MTTRGWSDDGNVTESPRATPRRPLVWFFSVVNNLFRSPPAGEFDAPQALAAVGEWEPPPGRPRHTPNSCPTPEVALPGRGVVGSDPHPGEPHDRHARMLRRHRRLQGRPR